MGMWWPTFGGFVAHPLVAPLSVSAVAGLAAYVTARRWPLFSRLVSLAASVCVLVLTVRLFVGPSVSIEQPWLEVGEFRVVIAMSNRPFGALIAMGAAFFGTLIALYVQTGQRGRREEERFHAFLCWTLTGAVGAALADDLIWLLICWEVVSLCLYMLLSLGRSDEAAGAAAKTFAMLGFGDGAMLLAIVLIGVTQGTFRMDALSIQVGTPITYICYLLFVAAALAKAGAVPLHSWIPTAAPSASAAVFALLPASLDKLLGIYLLATFSLRVFVLDSAMKTVLMVIGAVTILAAVLMAMIQHHLKKLLAFHAVSQVGYMVLGIGTGVPVGIIGGVFHMVNNAIYKSCLFLTAGVVERRAGTDDLDRLGGLARVLPVTFVCCVVSALAISGIPPLNGFVSKWFVYQGCLAAGSPLALLCLVAAVFGSALTLASFVKVLASVFLGPETPREAAAGGSGERPVSAVPMLALAGLCIVFGVAAWWPLNHLILPVVADAGVTEASVVVGPRGIDVKALGLWAPAPATILVLFGVLGGLVLYLIGRVGRVRVTNTFAGGEVFEGRQALKFAASGYYRTVEELPGVGGALHDGGRGAFDVYRLGGAYGGTFVEFLRRRHSGVLSLYVSWCLVGVVVIAVYLMVVR